MVQPECSFGRSRTASRWYGQEVWSARQTQELFPLGVSKGTVILNWTTRDTKKYIHFNDLVSSKETSESSCKRERAERRLCSYLALSCPEAGCVVQCKLPGLFCETLHWDLDKAAFTHPGQTAGPLTPRVNGLSQKIGYFPFWVWKCP